MTSVTLDLPTKLYQQAMQMARATQRPVEQVVIDWIQPPMQPAGAGEDALVGLDDLSTAELIEVAKSKTPQREAQRLQTLLEWQQQRALTYAEREEADRLVRQEDALTLRKAKAIYLLRQRKALPQDLAAFLM
jgi:hypothetical protein